METKPTVYVPDDVHLSYDGVHEFIKHDPIVTPPPSILTPIPEESCECNAFNPECKICQTHTVDYLRYLEHMNHSAHSQLKEMTDAYNTLRSTIPTTLMTYYNDGFTHGMAVSTTAIAIGAVGMHYILKYFGR
jgi:hypothetical protein